MRICCYGAVEEIGGNKILLEDGGCRLLLDFGKSFGGEARFFDEFLSPRTNSALRDSLTLHLLPPIEGIYRHDLLHHGGAWRELSEMLPASARRLFDYDIPSYQDYVAQNGSPRISGVLLSHAHADHAQHLAYLDPEIPVYCSASTHAVLRAVQETGQGNHESDIVECPERTLSRAGAASTFPGDLKIERSDAGRRRKFELLKPLERTPVAGFHVTALAVDHSVPGAFSYIIETPSGKKVFYTGDLRFHGRYSAPPNDLTSVLREVTNGMRPDVIITEGTRIESESGDDEADVERGITQDISACEGLAIVSFGWKDTTRLVSVMNAARAAGRVLVVSPKAFYLWSLLSAQDSESFPPLSPEEVKVFLGRTESMLYSRSDYAKHKYEAGIDTDWGHRGANLRGRPESPENPYLCHYYGGVRAYHIADKPEKYVLHAGYFDMNDLLDCDPPAGSVYVKAETEPFCDEMRIDEEKLSNWLGHFGILSEGESLTRHHVSGHANGTELLQFIADVKPARVIPIHTESPNVFQDSLGEQCEVVIPKLGEPIEIG